MVNSQAFKDFESRMVMLKITMTPIQYKSVIKAFYILAGHEFQEAQPEQ